MGDRANIVIREDWQDQGDKEAVFLYSHWGGYELPQTLRDALVDARGRWDDAPYLARMIFDRMIDTEQGGETGFGISNRLTDNEYDLIVLYDGNVYRVPESTYKLNGFTTLAGCNSISFTEFVAALTRTWDNLTVPAEQAVLADAEGTG